MPLDVSVPYICIKGVTSVECTAYLNIQWSRTEGKQPFFSRFNSPRTFCIFGKRQLTMCEINVGFYFFPYFVLNAFSILIFATFLPIKVPKGTMNSHA